MYDAKYIVVIINTRVLGKIELNYYFVLSTRRLIYLDTISILLRDR